jgi:hypothetical protein
MSPDIVDLTDTSVVKDKINGLAVITDKKPVAYIATVAVNGKRPSFEDIFDDKRDELFGEVVRAVVIGTTSDSDREAVGIVIGFDNKIGSRFGGTIRAMRVQGGRFMKETFVAETTVYFIGGYLMKAYIGRPERITVGILSGAPCVPCSVKKVLGAEDIGGEEKLRVFNTAIHMTFGCKVNDIANVITGEQVVDKYRVTNVPSYKNTTVPVDILMDSGEVTGIGQEVEGNDTDVFTDGKQVFEEIGADKPGGSGNQVGRHRALLCSGKRGESAPCSIFGGEERRIVGR